MTLKVLKFKKDKKVAVEDTTEDTTILEQGDLVEGLKYVIYKRGNISISSKDPDLTFRKDVVLFDDLLQRAKGRIEDLPIGENIKIPGAGDTDTLVLIKEASEIKIVLEPRKSKGISALQDIITRGMRICSKNS